MKAKPSGNINWLLKIAADEDNCELGVGGLAHELAVSGWRISGEKGSGAPRNGAFSQLIVLRRREQRLSVEDLAARADIELAELLEIERGTRPSPPDVATVFKLATTLRLPERPLLRLAGIAASKNDAFAKAAVRFDARFQPIEKLSREEHKTLREFMKFLAKR